MGTWEVSKRELIETLTECLDETEGDFDTSTLLDALEFMKLYCPTSDSLKYSERVWRRKLKFLFSEDSA